MELLERGNERGVVDRFVFCRQRRARADFFEDIVDVSQAEFVSGLGALAVGIEFLGECADFFLLLFGAVGEGEGIDLLYRGSFPTPSRPPAASE
ncbi:MAG: hypothetical protein ABIV50_09070 [Opitutus sp.]